MIETFYAHTPYEWSQKEKEKVLTEELSALTQYHMEHCMEYRNILAALSFDVKNVSGYLDIHFLTVRLFKELELRSIPKKEVFKTMTSSGTTGQSVSRIFLDRETAMMQQKVMVKILSDYLGKKRLPMLIIDTPSVIRDRSLFTARGAAILGLQVMAKKMVFALNEDMSLNWECLDQFLEEHSGEKFLIFGFTFLVWQHFYQEVKAQKERGRSLGADLSEAWLMTGGGWKKLQSLHISNETFKQQLGEVCGIRHFLDHYGMVEQTGCIYAECEYGHLHASIYSDVIPRRYEDFSPCEIGENGILQVVSVLPHSYPGHSLLTEDEGMVLGVDDCPCGRKGKYIKISGRLKQAELRGCSDTYAAKF